MEDNSDKCKSTNGLQEGLRRLRCDLEEVSTSVGSSLSALNERLCAAACRLRSHSAHTLATRGDRFAAIVPPFARTNSNSGGEEGKRKKKKIPRPGERPEREETDSADPPQPQKQRGRRAAKQKWQHKPKMSVKDEDDKDTPESVRALNDVKEPFPGNETEAKAAILAVLRSRMSDEDKAAFDRRVWGDLGRQIRVKRDGKEVSLRKLAKEAEREQAIKSMSADEPAIRHRPRDEIMSEIPGWELRPDAPKMALRPEEENSLDLTRLGEGHVFSPHRLLGNTFGGLHDFAWGMFGRMQQTRALLERNWAGQNPDEVLKQQEFYDDILEGANKMELTLMMVAARPIPVKQLREKFLERQSNVLSIAPEGSEEIEAAKMSPLHKLYLARIKRQCTVDALSKSGLIDDRGRLIPDSKLIVSVGPDWQLSAEAITAGRLKDQRTVFLGHWQDKEFAQGVLENFLGLPPVDALGKTSVGNGMLYVANGFNFDDPPVSGKRNQFYNMDNDMADQPMSSTVVEEIRASPDLFTMTEAKQPPLLTDISRKTAPRLSSSR